MKTLENPPEIEELVQKAKSGDFNSRNKLIEENFKAPLYMAKKKRPLWLEEDEAVSIANLYLVKAVDSYIKKELPQPLSVIIWKSILWGFSYDKSKKEIYGQWDTMDNDVALLDFENDQSSIESKLIRQEKISLVHKSLERLPSHKSEFLCRHYGIGCPSKTLKEIAESGEISTTKAQNLHIAYLRAFKKQWYSLRESSGFFAM